MAGKISDMTAATAVADVDQVEVLQGGVNKRATSILFVTAAKIATALGYTPANAASVPVKATGAEIDTGTDDAKFATAKAIEDSSYIKAAYADAKVADAINDGTTAIAPSQNAVFDALAAKQATLVSGTNIKTVNGATLLGSGDLVVSGGYAKLTTSGANNGIFTFYDDTVVTGETRVAIREGADLSGFENLFEIQNNAGTPQWYIGGANNDFRTYMPPSGFVDINERYFRVSSGGFKAPSDGAIGFTDGTNVYAAFDAYFGRSAAGVVDVLTTAAALAKLRCADLAVLGGDVSLGAADSGGAGFKLLRIPN